jgi:hypothetical protein
LYRRFGSPIAPRGFSARTTTRSSAAPTNTAPGVHPASISLTVGRLAAVPDGELADIKANDRPIDDYELRVRPETHEQHLDAPVFFDLPRSTT